MAGPDSELAVEFERHRRTCFAAAYRMLGSVADAEDAVQEAWLRWAGADRSDVLDAGAYLVRVTTRLALNRLRAVRARRESYVGPWLPEPLVTELAEPDPSESAVLAETASMAMLVVLETLSPLERAVSAYGRSSTTRTRTSRPSCGGESRACAGWPAGPASAVTSGRGAGGGARNDPRTPTRRSGSALRRSRPCSRRLPRRW